ncbi:MAG: phospho-sugar mutase [Candidatus Andersenbacteria bacterium]|nr:phospho-sugar mutase [Candidatus Andersenbacteria bacterium]
MQNNLSQEAQKNVDIWLTDAKYAEYKPELEKLIADEDWKTLEDSFFMTIPFGTGGRRGKVGIGSNRMNKATIGESAQGLCDYVVAQLGEDAKKAGIVIAHDTRTTSREFAEYTASIITANGFTTYLFDSFRATPELSFAVRHLKAVAGIVISASHNPPQDNGFKAYWTDGAQIIQPHDKGIIDAVENVASLPDIKNNLEGVQIIGKEVDDAYIAAIAQESLSKSRSAIIAYSPLHGTGTMSAQKILEHVGFQNLTIVEEQATPDGSFPNLPNNIPNPEVPSASEMVTQYAERLHADIAITTDPDADRLGVVVQDTDGIYKLLTGNQIAALAAYYVASKGAKGFVVRTIVTTDMLDAISEDFGLNIYNNILVGFKYVAQLIREKQDEGDETFLIGGEESYGMLKGSYCRDKDAAVAALLLCELASELKDQGKTLMWQLNELYKKYGVFTETLANIQYPGADGFANMQRIMKQLREHPPTDIAGTPITAVVDREKFEGTEKGNVLIFELSDDHHTRLTIRPSGTEPKIKIYTQLHAPVDAAISDAKLGEVKTSELARANTLTEALTKLAQ